MKFKKWIQSINRIEAGRETRHNKMRLDKNERVSPFDKDFWNEVITKIKQEDILAYPEIVGFYNRLAKFLCVSTDNLMITAGSDFAIKVAFELFVNPGDSVMILDPTFAMVYVYCRLFNANKIVISYDSNLNLDIDKLEESITPEISLIIIANPNSPTGTYLDNDTLRKVLERSKQISVPVIIDEAYYGFCPHTAIDLLKSFENLIIIRTFSKAAGLAGLRIGYMIANPRLRDLLLKFRPMYEVNSIAILFASELLDRWTIVDHYINDANEGKKYIIKELEKLSFKTINTYTNFLHVDFGRKRDRILRVLEREGVLLRGGPNVAGFEEYRRITVGPIDKMSKVIKIIRSSIIS